MIEDGLGDRRETFPLTAYVVAGTQAERQHTNNLIVMKMHNLYGTNQGTKKKEDTKKEDEDSEDDSDSESDADDENQPELETAVIKHQGCVNRVRVRRKFMCCVTGSSHHC